MGSRSSPTRWRRKLRQPRRDDQRGWVAPSALAAILVMGSVLTHPVSAQVLPTMKARPAFDGVVPKFMGQGSREMLGAVIRQAHARGLKVSGHLCSVTFTEAAALGIDALQHGFITNSDYVPDKPPDMCPPDNMRVQADVVDDDVRAQAGQAQREGASEPARRAGDERDLSG